MLNLRHATCLGLVVLAALLLASPGAAQFVTPPKDTGLVIDNVLPARPAKVLMNLDHDAYSGKLPTGIYYMELVLSHYQGKDVSLQMTALFHAKGAYLVLNDAAYNRVRHTTTGNPWKQKLAALQQAGVTFELCAFTAYNNGWVNKDLLPGVKVDNDVLLRMIQLVQDGYVAIQP
jgi:intracellular sulfur oxidation DsrE/DsrF family protein